MDETRGHVPYATRHRPPPVVYVPSEPMANSVIVLLAINALLGIVIGLFIGKGIWS